MNINISFVSETADGDIRGTTRTRLCLIDAYTGHLARHGLSHIGNRHTLELALFDHRRGIADKISVIW